MATEIKPCRTVEITNEKSALFGQQAKVVNPSLNETDWIVKLSKGGNLVGMYSWELKVVPEETDDRARWATLEDVKGTGCLSAPNRLFRIDVDDVGKCTPIFFRSVHQLRQTIMELTSVGGLVWLLTPDEPCHYPVATGSIVAMICRRDRRDFTQGKGNTMSTTEPPDMTALSKYQHDAYVQILEMIQFDTLSKSSLERVISVLASDCYKLGVTTERGEETVLPAKSDTQQGFEEVVVIQEDFDQLPVWPETSGFYSGKRWKHETDGQWYLITMDVKCPSLRFQKLVVVSELEPVDARPGNVHDDRDDIPSPPTPPPVQTVEMSQDEFNGLPGWEPPKRSPNEHPPYGLARRWKYKLSDVWYLMSIDDSVELPDPHAIVNRQEIVIVSEVKES